MKRLPAVALLSLAAVIAAVPLACGGSDKQAYADANSAVLGSLPVYPGAQIASQGDNFYHLTEPEGPSGWTTDVVYRVGPEVTDAEVIQFYTENMSGWNSCRNDVGIVSPVATGQTPGPVLGTILMAGFVRGHTTVGLDTSGLNEQQRDNTFRVGIDSNAYKDSCTGEVFRTE